MRVLVAGAVIGALSLAVAVLAIDLRSTLGQLEDARASVSACEEVRYTQSIALAELRGRLATYREALTYARTGGVGGP
jgi:hypothetical protein